MNVNKIGNKFLLKGLLTLIVNLNENETKSTYFTVGVVKEICANFFKLWSQIYVSKLFETTIAGKVGKALRYGHNSI